MVTFVWEGFERSIDIQTSMAPSGVEVEGVLFIYIGVAQTSVSTIFLKSYIISFAKIKGKCS